VSHLADALRLATAIAIVGGFAALSAATASADPPSPDVNTLAGSLSKGYTLSNCSASDQPPSGVLAVINCPQNPDASGPAQATYLLFGNGDDMKGSWKTSTKDLTMANCGDTQSPTVWSQQQGSTAGQVACGTYQGVAEIIWSNNSKNVVSMIRGAGADVPALYQWWRIKG
jgi:hypothetical protein